jgi:tetratricopeptide (TPR) repeat protein
MTLQGDLATLELADIVQNLEMHRRSGSLEVETLRGTSRIYFAEGAVALFAADWRPTLVEDLVRAGFVTAKQVDSARSRRWRARKPLGQVLVKRKAIDEEALRRFAHDRLLEDLCEFLASDGGAFTFTEERVPRGVFDPEERALALAIQPGPALFEAARRKDHGPLIRGRVPSDAAHYLAPEVIGLDVEGDPALVRDLAAHLDGTKSVRQVLLHFPHRRFEAWEMLARLVDAQAIRTVGPTDMVELAERLSTGDGEAAWRVVQDGLDMHPQRVELLRSKAKLATERGDAKAAAEALKMIAHVQLEADDRRGALVELARAAQLDPSDTAVGERLLELAIEDGRHEEAIAHGFRLVELFRAPGLHSKACAVLESLVRLDPERWEIHRELARSRADCGDAASAVAGLERHGKKLLAREDYRTARLLNETILELLPSHKQAQLTIERIDAKVFERRRARRRRIYRNTALLLAGALFVAYLVLDVLARLDYARANSAVSRHSMIEERRYGEAIVVFERVRERHPITMTALFDVHRRLEDLEAKRVAATDVSAR